MFKFFACVVSCGVILFLISTVTVLAIMIISGYCLELIEKFSNRKNKNGKQNHKSKGIKLEELWFNFLDYPEKLTYSVANEDKRGETVITNEMESFIHKYGDYTVDDFIVQKTENGFNLFIYI